MRKIQLGTCIALAGAVAANASANFVGIQIEKAVLGNGHTYMNVYATFTNAGDRVLNVYRTNISTTVAGGFHQSAGNPYWKAGNTQNLNTSDDSWVNIGSNPNGTGAAGGNGGTTVADPNFVNFDDANDSTDFSVIESVGNGAGWYNGNPANTYGYAFDAGRVLLAHLAVTSTEAGDYVSWESSLTVMLASGASGEIESGPLVFNWNLAPGPGGLGLLAVGAIQRRRRRVD